KVEATSSRFTFIKRGWKPRSTVEKVTVSGHSHPGYGAGGHPACRQVRESDRQDAYLPHSQDGCAPSSGALFNKAKPLLLNRVDQWFHGRNDAPHQIGVRAMLRDLAHDCAT